MDKKYVARQYALAYNNIQKVFRTPTKVIVGITREGESVLEQLMDMDECRGALKRYGFDWDILDNMSSYKGEDMIFEIDLPLGFIIENIPDKRVREYLCTMFQNISQ